MPAESKYEVKYFIAVCKQLELISGLDIIVWQKGYTITP